MRAAAPPTVSGRRKLAAARGCPENVAAGPGVSGTVPETVPQKTPAVTAPLDQSQRFFRLRKL